MNKLILIVVCLATTLLSQAQEKSSITTFGVKGGVNVSSGVVTKKYFESEIKSKTGAHIGVFTNIRMGNKFAFQPEMTFSMQGLEQNYTQSTSSQEAKTKVNYLEIPLNFQFKVVDKVFIEAGPYFDLLLSAKGDVKSSQTLFNNGGASTEVVEVKNENLKANYSSIVLGYNFGAGYKITDKIAVNGRYYMGISPMYKSDVRSIFYAISSKSRLLQFSVAYSF